MQRKNAMYFELVFTPVVSVRPEVKGLLELLLFSDILIFWEF